MKYILMLAIGLSFTACSPKYEIKTHYTLPTDSRGQQGIERCLTDKQDCQRSCNQKQAQCQARKEDEVRQNFPNLMREFDGANRAYENEMNRFGTAMQSWEHEHERLERDFTHYRHLCDVDGDGYQCERAREMDNKLRFLSNDEPDAPARPVQPNLSQEIRNAQKHCSSDCGCDKGYDSCFVSYGGKLDFERICVENCD